MNFTLVKIAFLIYLGLASVICSSQSDNIEIYKTPLSTFFESATYKGGIQNWRFAQDSSNILYVANSFGLLEFDGEKWNKYGVPNSTKTRALYIDKSNTIFVGSQGQLGYFILESEGLKFTSLVHKLPMTDKSIDEVWNIFEWKNNIHFQTSNGLYLLKDSMMINPFPRYNLTASFKLRGKIIVQNKDAQLLRWEADTLIPYAIKGKQPERIISAIDHGSTTLLFCENGQVFEVTKNNEIIEKQGLSKLFSKPLINVAISLSSGDIGIGTQNDGLFILDENLSVTRHMTRKQGLEHRTVYSLYEDHFNNLWVGLNNGISYIELSSPLSLINEEVGLEGTGYTAAMHQGKLYLGTNNGLFSRTNVASETEFEIIPGTEGIVYGLSSNSQELLMTHHTGAYSINNGRLNHFFDDYGAWKLTKTPKSNKLIGGTYNGFSFFNSNGNSWELQWNSQRFKESSRIFEWENDSVIWMTHGYKGAFRITLKKDYSGIKSIRQYGVADGFPSNLLISVYKLNDRLIFTSESGVFEYDPVSDKFLLSEFLSDWLSMNHVSKITPFGEGHILFIANDELGLLHEQSFGKYLKEVNIFKRINKYLSNDLENINVIDDQNILIGAKEGFIHFNPSTSLVRNQPFKTLLRGVSVVVKNEPQHRISSAHFSGRSFTQIKSMNFEFAAPYFDGFEDIKFSYRLIPYEKEWSNWSPENSKEYTNLPAGNYTFEVRSVNIYGNEGAPFSTSFKINNVWYKTSFAYALYTAIGLLLFGLISFLQDRKYRSEKLKLSQSKEYALKEKDEELTELTQKSKKEIEDLKNQKLKSEIHHKNNQLATVTMHLINKNEFVQEVRKKIDHMLRDKSTSADELKKIIKTIDQNHTQDDSWDQFAYHFDQVHGDFLKKLVHDIDKLTPQETKLAAYLRMNMSSKEIANLMGISVRGVELARYRLRKKLGLDRDQNLNDYLMQI